MDALQADSWPHKTSSHIQDTENIVGVALFDMEVEGEIQTAVYYQYKDGTRWPCRTIVNTERGRETLMHWMIRGVVHDERADKWEHPIRMEPRGGLQWKTTVEGKEIHVELTSIGEGTFYRLALHPASKHVCLTPTWQASLPQIAVEQYVQTLKERELWPV